MGPFFKGWIPADFHKTQIAHSTQLEGSNPQSEGAYGKSVFSPPDPGTAPPENRKPEMGWFSKGWKTDFPSRFSRPLKKGPISARARSRYVSPEKNAFCPVTIPKWFCRTLQTHAFNATVASAGKKGASQAVKKGLQGTAGRAGFRTCGNGPVFQRLDSGGFPQNSNRSFDPTRRQ
jgi:hypothetical protein